MLKGQMTSVLRLAKLDFRYERSLSSMVTCSNFIIAFFLWTQHLLCNYYTIFQRKSKQLFDFRRPDLCSFCISEGEVSCDILRGLRQNRWYSRGKQLEKDPRLLPASRLMHCLCAAAVYSILHLAGLILVWYNAGFGLFLGWCLMVF